MEVASEIKKITNKISNKTKCTILTTKDNISVKIKNKELITQEEII